MQYPLAVAATAGPSGQPSVSSGLQFLRKTPWARENVESLYLFVLRERARRGRAPHENQAAAALREQWQRLSRRTRPRISRNQVAHTTGQRRRTGCAGLLRTISRRAAITFRGVGDRSRSDGRERTMHSTAWRASRNAKRQAFSQRIARKLLIGELHRLLDERDGTHGLHALPPDPRTRRLCAAAWSGQQEHPVAPPVRGFSDEQELVSLLQASFVQAADGSRLACRAEAARTRHLPKRPAAAVAPVPPQSCAGGRGASAPVPAPGPPASTRTPA